MLQFCVLAYICIFYSNHLDPLKTDAQGREEWKDGEEVVVMVGVGRVRCDIGGGY